MLRVAGIAKSNLLWNNYAMYYADLVGYNYSISPEAQANTTVYWAKLLKYTYIKNSSLFEYLDT